MKTTSFYKTTLILLSFITLGFSQESKKEGIFASIKTSKGNIFLELYFTKTPITVANFVSLAEGKNQSVKAEYLKKPFYDGIKFHRVIPNFMIQTGDPLGTGAGDPGYKFTDEITDKIHSGPGILSMANAGPGTNGSQFFITHKETPWLDGKHTVFGKIISGQDVVDAIAQNDVVESITITRIGKLAKQFKAEKVFKEYMKNKEIEDKRIAALNTVNISKIKEIQEAEQKKQAEIEEIKRIELEAKLIAVYAENKANYNALMLTSTKTVSGLQYVVTKKGSGIKPTEGTTVYIHYAGFFEDGKLFDSSYPDVSKKFGKFDENRASQNGYAPFPFQYGNKGGLIPGFLEGINLMSFGDKLTLFIPSNLGYGEQGAGGVIPPNANLIFEVELLESK